MGILKGSTRTRIPVTGGMDESSPVNMLEPGTTLKMENFRISKDGKRVEKRLGLAEEVTDFGVDVYGYCTYYNNANTYCQLAVLESGISRKVGSAAWAPIHTWSPVTLTGTIDPTASVNVVGVGTKFLSELRTGNGLIVSTETRTVSTIADDTHCTVTTAFSNNANDTSPDKSFTLAHPVKPIETQGKLFVIHEDAGRMVHWDGNDYQIGITAPTTLPTASESYTTVTEGALVENELFAYDNQGAMDAVWTDGDTSNGASTLATSGPATTGPDGVAKYLKMAFSGGYAGACLRTDTVDIGSNIYTIDTAIYFKNTAGYDNRNTRLHLKVYNGAFCTDILWSAYQCKIVSATGNQTLSSGIKLSKWQTWKFVVDGSIPEAVKITCYLAGVKQNAATFTNLDTTTADSVVWYETATGTANLPDIYVDNIKISQESTYSSVLEGTHRYAVTFGRGGNYGCESNPIKSSIGAVTFAGTGLNDMTVSSLSTYTGDKTRTFRVQVDGASTPDTIKWSEDDGVTWNSETLAVSTTLYISYGLVINFGATSGHTSTDYWYFTASVCSGTPTKQKVTLSSIPTSSDSQVTHRNIYRTTSGGATFYWLARINDNTTTGPLVDNIPDMELGTLMEEDHDIAPNGKFSAWWDNRLWVSGDDIVYYSAIGVPEHFDLSERYITVNKGDATDEITGLVPFKDALYVFRKKSIYSIQANTYGYGIYLVENHTGCRAPWSMVEVNNNLMFISDRGIEVFNGSDCYPMALSDKIERTIRTIDTSKYDYITATLVRDKYEVWFSVPDRTSGSAVTVVYNYIYGKFYYFSFYKTPSCLVSCENASYALVTKMGTRDGYLDLCESTYRDNTTAIAATYRTGWFGGEKYENVRRIDCEYELPASMTLTANIYVNFQKTAARTVALAGSTPNATDIELRRPIKGFGELGQRAEYWAVELTNAENLGGDLKLNGVSLYHYETATKGSVKGD